MASPEKVAELAARLRSLADSVSTHRDPGERAKTSLQEAAMELEQNVIKFHSRGDAHVLVLIDAHSHPFNSDIQCRSPVNQSFPALDHDQAFNIKKRLHAAIRKHLIMVSPAAALATARIIVRVYADSTKLANDLLCPLQQFMVEFSSIDPDFDFISVRDEEIVGRKVTVAFDTARRDPNCKHVFLAAWRRPLYLAMLQTPSKNVTLVQGRGMGAGAKLVSVPCDSISIPEVFYRPAEQDLLLPLLRSVGKPAIASMITDKDSCASGSCGFSHADTTPNDMFRRVASNHVTDTLRRPGFLPQFRDAVDGYVPVNKDGQRLDYFTARPSPADRQAYAEKFGRGVKPCRWFYLANACEQGAACPYNHFKISPSVLNVLRYNVRKTACKKGSDCRRLDCIFGHVCQNKYCLTDELDTCYMKQLHGVDPEFDSWVKGMNVSARAPGNAEEALVETADYTDSSRAESSWF